LPWGSPTGAGVPGATATAGSIPSQLALHQNRLPLLRQVPVPPTLGLSQPAHRGLSA
jgi:hypothetical protein